MLRGLGRLGIAEIADHPDQVAAPLQRSQGLVFVNGVFKGGGAKGIVYAGALRAVHENKIRFGSVAGSSAGAITATLIAAKLTVDEIQNATEEGLAALRGRFPFAAGQLLGGLLPGREKTLFSVTFLERWLDGILSGRMSTTEASDRGSSVTFGQLYEATKVELYVVALDLETRQPLVFHRATTPRCSVARAVLASSAIPVAMPPGRVVLATDGGTSIHRLVDGGAWANYPAFVFRDASFRSYHQLGDIPMEADTLGFTIDERPPRRDQRPSVVALEDRRRSPTDLGSGARAGLPGGLLNWPALRLAVLFIFPTLIGFVFLDWLRFSIDRFFPFVQHLPTALQPLSIVVFVATIAALFSFGAVVLLLLYRFGTHAFDVGYPTLLASISVGPRVPDWVGDAGDQDRVIRLSPPQDIKTLSFRIREDVRNRAIDAAHEQSLDALAQMTFERS